MALQTTSLSCTIVKNALGSGYLDVASLCVDPNINKWSRYKPVRGVFPAGLNGKFGFNLPTDWSYLKPRGHAISVDENYELGEFRGYEHNIDIAGPVVYCKSSDVNLLSAYSPSITNTQEGSWILKMNTVTDNVRIIPSDLGIQNYYWGMNLNGHYKTLGSVLANNATLSFSIVLNIDNPDQPSFTDLPFLTGTVNWELFICSNPITAWTTTYPSNYIKLPGNGGEVNGSITIKSSGSFVINDWIIGTLTSAGWQYNEGTYTNYIATKIMCATGTWHIHQIPAGFSIKNGGGGDLSVGSTGSSGSEVRIFPTGTNNGTDNIMGEFVFHDSNNNAFNFEVVQAANGIVNVGVIVEDGGRNSSFTLYDGSGMVSSNDTHITLYVVATMEGYSEGQQIATTYSVTRNGNYAGSGYLTIKSSYNNVTTPYPVAVMLENAQVGDTIILTINV